ncbi:MAG: diguanylate cyclase domain-containing protein [Pseudomarimonas sp.]
MQNQRGPVPNQRVVRAFELYARGSGVFAVIVGILVLVGWWMNFEPLTTLVPGLGSMKANTAIGLILAGTALVFFRARANSTPAISNPTTSKPAISKLAITLICSSLLVVLGGAELLQYLAGFDLGIDTFLFADPKTAAMGLPAGRMSELTAAALLLLGMLGLAIVFGHSAALSQLLAITVLALALFALGVTGYSLGANKVEWLSNPTAIHTGFSLLLLALGWLAARPEAGMMRVVSSDSLGGVLARRALLPSLLIPSLLSFLAELAQSREWLSTGNTIVLLAVASGCAVAALVWWASDLLDKVERQRRLNHELQDSAESDVLTGLGNRRLFDRKLTELMRSRRESESNFSLLMLDIDRFKQFNDNFGHLAGDEALRTTGRLLQHALRPGDIAARYGGEEFAVLLPGIDVERARRVAERICNDFRAHTWAHRPVTVSIGATDAHPNDSEQQLVGRADAALYAAKQGGRDRVEWRVRTHSIAAAAELPASGSPR